ncbi:hypothetical protein ABOM_007066 [Aspergillus bombycis]|uniref:Involucrin repeat protein n=1 Tax=Aspergillus bombycis TaxID=109264 RepID=A0A1F7ZZU0_9EURO|nr:hypothetical protein ABOM_007066 [Aspergillus bombycis]OGM44973.1 hypothetical protein ABOM_007066 [Aspergillus bombycis]
MKDQGSVQFDLTKEQVEKERRADHLERIKRDCGPQGVQLIDRESEIAAQEDKNSSRRSYEGYQDSDHGSQEQYRREPRGESGPASTIELATVGAIGGITAASVLSGQGSNGGSSESSQRRHYERSEKRRAERRRVPGSEISSGLPMPDRAYNDVDQRPNPNPEQEHIKTSVFSDIPRKKPVHHDYAQFFAPEELRYSPDTYMRREPASIPTIIEVEPASQKSKPAEEPRPEYRGLPWPVPELKVVEPTPPQSQNGSVRDIASPIPSPPEAPEDERISRRSTTGSRISWGKDETREYEVPSTSSELDSADHEIMADRGQEKQTGSEPTQEIPAIQTDLSKGDTSEYDTDIEVAATAAAVAAAAGFGPSVVSDIRENLASPSGARGYVGEEVTPDDGEKQPILGKFVENGPAYSEPASMRDGVRTFYDDQPPSSIAQEVIQQLTGEQAPEVGELPRRAVEEPNESGQMLVFRDKRSGPESPAEEVLHMPGGFELEESSSQREPRGDTQESAQDDSSSITSAAIPRHSEAPTEEVSYCKDSRESDIPSRASPPAVEEGSTIEKKKRKKRYSTRDSDAFDDTVSVTSSSARVEETGDRSRTTDEQAKEKRTGGLFTIHLARSNPKLGHVLGSLDDNEGRKSGDKAAKKSFDIPTRRGPGSAVTAVVRSSTDRVSYRRPFALSSTPTNITTSPSVAFTKRKLNLRNRYLPYRQDEKNWEKIDLSPSIHRDQRHVDVDMPSDSQHGVLGSQEVTPTAASFGQINAYQPPRKDKPKYEFHSPSELLQDPCTYAELPPSPTMGLLPSAEGSAVGVKDDGRLERNLDSLPSLPVSRPSTPESEQLRASDAAEENLTRELTAPDFATPRTGNDTPSADVDTPIMKVLDIDLRDLQPSDEKAPTKATRGNIESGDALMSHEPTSQGLPDEAIPVRPAVQVPTIETVEKVREDLEQAATTPVDIVNVAIADSVLPAEEERALSAEPLQSQITDEAKPGISATVYEKAQPQEAPPGVQSEPQKPATEDNESLGNAEAKTESNSNLTSAKILSVEGEEAEIADGATVTGSAKPITGSIDKAANEAVQAPIAEELTVDATSPSSSKKKKKAKKKKTKSVDLHDQEPQDTAAIARAAPSSPEDVEKKDGAMAEGETPSEQISPPESIEKSTGADVESATDLLKPDEAANVQVSVDMPVSEPEPVVNITRTEDALAAENEVIASDLKAGEEAGMQAIEGRPLSEWEPTVQSENPQSIVDLAAPVNLSKQEPPLEILLSEDAPLAADTSITEQKPNPEALETDAVQETQAPEVATAPVQGLSKVEDALTIPDVLVPEQVIPKAEGDAHRESFESDKMQDFDAKQGSTEREAAANTDTPTNSLESDKESKRSDVNESVKELGGVEFVMASKTEPEASVQAGEKPSKSVIGDYQPVEEDLVPSKEETISTSEHPMQGIMEGAESLEFSGQDVVLPEKSFEHAEELDEQSKEYRQSVPQDSTEHSASAQDDAPRVVSEPSTVVLEPPTEATSLSVLGGHKSPAADLQEGLIPEASTVDPAPVESESGPSQLESGQTTTTEEAKASMEPGSGKISSEQDQMQGNAAPVQPTSSPESAAEVAEAGTKCQDTDVTDAQTETSLSRRSSKKNKKKSKRDGITVPPEDKGTNDVPPNVPSSEGATPQVEDDPAVPPKEEPEARQSEETPGNEHEGAMDVSPERTPGATADTRIESQDADIAEMAQKAGLEEASEGQSTKKGKKKKKNRKSISSDSQAVADAETQPPLSAEGLPAETPLAEISGVVHPTEDKQIPQEATATNDMTETTEAVDANAAAENEPSVPVEYPAEPNDGTPHMFERVPDDPVPDLEPEAGESTPTGKKSKKNKKKKQSLQSASDAHEAAAEPTPSTDVASLKIDIPLAAEKPQTTEGQELVLEETMESEQPFNVTELAEGAASSETAPEITAAQKKKAKKEKKKQRRSALLDESPAFDPAIDLNPGNASSEHGPDSVGESAPVKEPEAYDASTEGPTLIDELASEQPRVETVTDTGPNMALDEGLDEQSQEPAQQEPTEAPTDIAGILATEVENVELGQTHHTYHTPSDLEGAPANEEQLRTDVDGRHTVEIMGVEQEPTNEKQVEVEDATLNAAPKVNADTALEQPQEETLNEKAAPDQARDAGVPLVDVIPQDAVEGEPEIPTPKKSKKDKKKKKKQQSISLEEDQPAAALEETAQEPSDARPDSLEISGKPHLSLPGDGAEEPQRAFSEEPTQQSGASEHECTESPEQADLTRPVESESMADTQESVSKKKARKDKKKRKSVSFAHNEQEAPTKSSETTEATEASHHIKEASQPPEQANEQMAEASSLVQTSQGNADSTAADEVQPGETTADLHKDVPAVANGENGSESNKGAIANEEQVTQPYKDSVAESQASTLNPDPTPSVARELENEPTVPEPEGHTNDDALAIESPEQQDVQQGTGILTALETTEKHEVESTPEASVPETPSTSVQDSTVVVQEVEQESVPSKSKKDKKKKKRKTQESIENEAPAVSEPSIEGASVETEEDNRTAAPGVIEESIEPNNAAKPSEISSQDVPPLTPESIAERTRAETEEVADSTVHEVKESERTEQQAREHLEDPQNDGAPAMSAKERKKAKKKEKKRQSKILDGSVAASVVLDEKTQGPLINASTTSTEDITLDAAETQASAELKPSGPSVDTATPPAEDDGKENQSHGTESHGENDKNLFWTDHMVSSQVDQQQATPLDSPTQTVPENTIPEKVAVSSEPVSLSEEIEVGTEDHASKTEQEATSVVDRVSLERLPAEGFAAEADESGKALTPKADELMSQQDTIPAQTDEMLEEKGQEAAPEARLVTAEVTGTSMDDLQATNEEAVPLSPAEAGVPEDLQETNNGSTFDVEKLEATAPWENLCQAREPEDPVLEDTFSGSNRLSTTSPERATREAKYSELQASSAGPALESDAKEYETASHRETRLDGVDLVLNPLTVESQCSSAEVTNTSESANGASSEIQTELGDLLPITSGEENRENKETPAGSDAARETPAGTEATAELSEANKKAIVDPVESLGPGHQPSAEKEQLQASIEPTPEQWSHEELKYVARTEGEIVTQPLNRKASKKQKKKAKKQAKEASIEIAGPSLAESKRVIDAESVLEPTVGSTEMAGAAESRLAPEEKPMQSQGVQGPQSESDVSKPTFEAVSTTEERSPPIARMFPNQTQATHKLQEGEGKDADGEPKLSSQTSEGGNFETAEERTQQEIAVPGSVSKEEEGKFKQEAELQVPEQTEQASGENTKTAGGALLLHEANPENSELPMAEATRAEIFPSRTLSRDNKQQNEENLSVGAKEPEESESVSGEANVKHSQDRYHSETLVTEQSAKDDEWPLIDWEKERVDASEQTPQSSPEACAAPFEPDESAEAIKAKAIMGPQGQDSEAKLATPEATVEPAEYVADQFAPSTGEPGTEPVSEATREHALDDAESSIPGKQMMGEPGSVSQKQSKIASIFPNLERGAFRRPITTKSSESVKDGAEDETNEQAQVSEAPIATTDGAMNQGQGTPRLEMKPEHVLPRPETPVRKFTDNALARQAWPTLDRDGDGEFHIRKNGAARSIDCEWTAEAIQTPERGILRPSSMGSIKSVRSAHSQRSLRRTDRSAGGDLRAASQAQTGARQSSCSPQPPPVEPPLSDLNIEHIASSSSYDPVTDKGKRPMRAMTDVYESWGEIPNSPRSPSRPPSIRHRRSMQHLQELETRLDRLVSENRLLVAAREAAEDKLRNASVARRKSDHALNERAADLRDREAEVEQLKNSVEWLQKEVSRLTEENERLTVTNSTITVAHAAEIQTIRVSSNRELDDLRLQNQQLSNEMQDRVRQEIDAALAQKNMELRRLREDLEGARDKVKELQQQIAASMHDTVLVFRDEDYFDAACQKLCGHVQQWVLRFSKHSDLRRCRKLDDIQDEKIADRFENAILDGSDADIYLSDRVRRRDIFMSVVMTMVWEFIFTRYLFGMDREQRQKLKSLEKQLGEVGPRGAVHRWRATTLSLLSKRPAFSRQRQNDTEAVALEIFETLSRLLPPPSNVESQLLESLRKVLRVAVNLSIEMRTQLAEYIMLPPLQPEYDTNGDLARQVYFNASLMNERSGETTSNEELESQQAVVRVVLFPLVVKKGNDAGEGEDEVVVCPAQVLVARSPKDKKVTRMLSGDRMSFDGTRSIHSIAPSSTMDMSNVI